MADWPKRHYKPNKLYTTKIYVVNDLPSNFSDVTVHWALQNDQAVTVASGDYSCILDADSIQTLGTIEYQLPPDAQGVYNLVLSLKFEEETIENKYNIKIK
jgi:MinD-like ATPase involved in chromosome partitioning or flagellar assembly